LKRDANGRIAAALGQAPDPVVRPLLKEAGAAR
jgi:hypothetical protein